MTSDRQIALLTAINAPYRNYLDAHGLCAALQKGEVARGQVASFFTETSVDAQKAFAKKYDISFERLVQTATIFADWSGQDVDLLA